MKSSGIKRFFVRIMVVLAGIVIFAFVFKLLAMFLGITLGLTITTYGGVAAALEADELLRGFVSFCGGVEQARTMCLFAILACGVTLIISGAATWYCATALLRSIQKSFARRAKRARKATTPKKYNEC